MIEENVKKLLEEIKENPYGEKVTLVAAVKTQTVEDINCAIAAGYLSERGAPPPPLYRAFADQQGEIPYRQNIPLPIG